MENKEYRFVSIEGCELIGQGKHGKVFQLNEEQIIKVYYDESSLDVIEREREYSRRAFVLGVPTAITFGVVKTELGYGVIYESAGIMPLGTYIENHPDKLEEYAKKMADILISLNHIEADTNTFDSVQDWYIEQIKNIPHKYLSQKSISSLIRILQAIPSKTSFIHTDFHPQNIMIDKKGELLLIDMADVGYGNSIFDMGSSYMTMCYLPKTNPNDCKEITGLSPENCLKVWDILIRRYYNTDDEELLKHYELRCNFLSDIRMAVILSFSIDISEFKKFIIGFIERWKVIRHEEKYIDILKN